MGHFANFDDICNTPKINNKRQMELSFLKNCWGKCHRNKKWFHFDDTGNNLNYK